LSNIVIVTDSTADLTARTAAEHGIAVVPVSVIHKGKTYLDGIDITSEAFYPMLRSSDELPTTSQPAPLQFQEVYERLLESADGIVSIHVSGELSATVDSASVAAASVSKERIHVVDSGFVSYALALQVLEAARLAREGRIAEDILTRMARLKNKMELAFTLDTLHYLHKGGRIGMVSALMGTVLGIKAVIRIEEGHLVPAGKERSTARALSSIVDILSKRYGQEKVVVAVGHGAGAEYASMLREMVISALNVDGEPAAFEIGPAVGVHAGPGAVGVAVRPVKY
jgi:DegV family protein with EDD domain